MTAAYWGNGRTYLRLTGTAAAGAAARDALGSQGLQEDTAFWRDVREHECTFF